MFLPALEQSSFKIVLRIMYFDAAPFSYWRMLICTPERDLDDQKCSHQQGNTCFELQLTYLREEQHQKVG